MEEVAGSDAKYQGWPEVIALRQRRRERRNRDAEAFFSEPLWLDFTSILESL